MTWYQITLIVLIYLLCGQLFSVAYMINYRIQNQQAWLGLISLFWPLYIVVDLLLQISGYATLIPKWFINKVDKK